MDAPLRVVDTVPFSALSFLGLGPLTVYGPTPRTLQAFLGSAQGVETMVETAGETGRVILSVLAALGGSATAEQFAFQTADADADEVETAVERLETSGLIVRDDDQTLRLHERLSELLQSISPSLADPHAITSDALAVICRYIDIKTLPRKHERIAAIAERFADTDGSEDVRRRLSPEAGALLDRIADVAGPGRVDSDDVGIDGYLLRSARQSNLALVHERSGPASSPLAELTRHGIVGVADWERQVWIWREAWPLLQRPFYDDWPPVRRRPAEIAVNDRATTAPGVVALVDRALTQWRVKPPVVLKNGDPRLGAADVKATAKALGVEQGVIDLVARLLIGIGLLLPNTVSETGRGRSRKIEQVWMADPTMEAGWVASTPLARWVRLLGEWCQPATPNGNQLLANRHLVLWELARLDTDRGYLDDGGLAAWIGYRYGSIGHPDAAQDCLVDLRALGALQPGVAALTPAARQALDDPAGAAAITVDEAATAIVQADLTVIAPPDLRHDLRARLADLSDLESEAGALMFRLSADRITRAVQGGATADDVVAFLAELSSVPLTDTVTRLVHDAAARAGRVKVINAPTVVVVSDPAELALICGVKAAKLVAVGETVAVSNLSHGKVRDALDRKGLAPELVLGGAERSARSSADDAAKAAARASAYRDASPGASSRAMTLRATLLEDQARALADVDGRLTVSGPLALTPAVAEQLGG